MTKNDITAGCSRCGGAEFNKEQINDKQRLRKGKEMQTKPCTMRGNGVEGAVRVPAGKEETGAESWNLKCRA